MNILEKGLRKLEIEYNNKQLKRLIDFREYIIIWGKKTGLTAIEDKKDITVRHLLDSITLLKILDLKNCNVIDYGTGIGIPGIPLAIMRESSKFILIDSSWRSERFIKNIVKLLELKNVEFKKCFLKNKGLAKDKKYDYILTRAVGSLNYLLDVFYDRIKRGEVLVAYKGNNVKKEIEDMNHSYSNVSYQINEVKVPIQQYKNNLVTIKMK